MDPGANVALTGGLSIQARESWAKFPGVSPDALGWSGKVSEVCFEEDDLDTFTDRLRTWDIQYVHPVKEHRWGQRVVRFYDPDGHIIEVGESMKTVVRRFLHSGMPPTQVAERVDVPIKFVNACMR